MTDYLIGVDQKNQDWVIEVLFLGEGERMSKSSIKSYLVSWALTHLGLVVYSLTCLTSKQWLPVGHRIPG